jgi:hypothetical protein
MDIFDILAKVFVYLFVPYSGIFEYKFNLTNPKIEYPYRRFGPPG